MDEDERKEDEWTDLVQKILEIVEQTTYGAPVVNSLAEVGDEPDMEGHLVFNRADAAFYGHDGQTWYKLDSNNNPLPLPLPAPLPNKEESIKEELVISGDHSEAVTVRALPSELFINFSDSSSIRKVHNNPDLSILSDGNIVLEGNDYVLLQSPVWATDGITTAAKNGVPGLTASESATWWSSDNTANGHPDNCEGIPLVSVRTASGRLATIETFNRWSILQLKLLRPTSINAEDDQVLCFGNPEDWTTLYTGSALKQLYGHTIDSLELDRCGASPPQGYVGGYDGKSIPQGLYKIEFRGSIRSNPHRPCLEDWSAAIIICMGEEVRDLDRVPFTAREHGLKTLMEKNGIPYAYEKDFYVATIYYADGPVRVGPNISSPTAAYQLERAYFTVTRIAS